MSLLRALQVSKHFRQRPGPLQPGDRLILDQVSLSIGYGETIALVGKSGCGKSTLARILMGLESPSSGYAMFEEQRVDPRDKALMQRLFLSVQMVFQDPVTAVSPRYTVGEIISEPLQFLKRYTRGQIRERVSDLLAAVHLSDRDYDKYPQQMSGGQLQRVCIARALAPGPRLIILDEAVSNLDLHLQIQVLDLFSELQHSRNVSYLFVSHDLRLVERFCTKVLIMDGGRIVETAPVQSPLFLKSKEGRALTDAILPAFPVSLAS
ncbi:MAG TPA: ATP-binding cassette domain-containing protein [Bordetella sp.]|nr:ATP-binding cassette domain-containing protein [Bordetella sp.]